MVAPRIQIPPNGAIGSADILSQLNGCSFRGVSFPVSSLDTNVTQDVIQHKRMDRDGAKLENTGLGAFTYSIKAPMLNTIAKGQAEGWSNLFPTGYNALLGALTDRTTGDFIHPYLGKRRCKCASIDAPLDPNVRSGGIISFTLVEDTEDDDAVSIIQNSKTALGVQAAFDIDAILGALTPPPKTGLNAIGVSSFSAFMTGLLQALGSASLAINRFFGAINAVIGVLNSLANLVDVIALFGDRVDILIDSLLAIRRTAFTSLKPVGFYETAAKTTLGQLSIQFKNSTSDLLTLNPFLASAPTITAHTVIRYYL